MGAQGWFVAIAGGEGATPSLGSAAPLKTKGTFCSGGGHFRAGGGFGNPRVASPPSWAPEVGQNQASWPGTAMPGTL